MSSSTSTTTKSFLIKDILSENCEISSSSSSSSSSDESIDNKEIFLNKPIDLRRFFNKHPLCPIPLRPSSLSSTSTTFRQTQRLDNDTHNSPLNALFEMTKKTFDKSDLGKSNHSIRIEHFRAFF